jgi:S-adenosylmethionine:tRNA ribosyltransferase-isomerase
MWRRSVNAVADDAPLVSEAECSLDAFDYPAAWARIAQSPVPVRDEARLLVYDRRAGRIAHRRFRDLPEYCAAGDAVVVNDSRVIPARLHGVKDPSGGRVEVLLVRRLSAGVWNVLVKGHVKPGQRLTFDGEGHGEILDPDESGRVRMRLHPDEVSWLERVGRVPLPPYLRRAGSGEADGDSDDRDRYQTVFARADGSVAAPTAGLHFTSTVLDRLSDRGVAVTPVTLHVGPGTFEPIRTARVDDHPMAGEWGEITQEAADRLNAVAAGNGRVFAVGTTTTRLLETVWGDDGVGPWQGDTALFIRPGYRWKAVSALVTNFHLPRSTPLLLAAAFCGRTTLLELYREAAREEYRFYSYGDGMLIL